MNDATPPAKETNRIPWIALIVLAGILTGGMLTIQLTQAPCARVLAGRSVPQATRIALQPLTVPVALAGVAVAGAVAMVLPWSRKVRQGCGLLAVIVAAGIIVLYMVAVYLPVLGILGGRP